ncbi:uncharacterized protein N7498_002621 [Penicillium cinerascens]|uniref:Uncharacterized protein n=1 Tax=Penicillium cinerascens TaxID=70096 RepID=A0A9W9TBE3_9EURO|nr:uncharacterized protein N7498_002621 [Penicillium cinerascens]KAJ5216214.1 hypothetical protein N7498_002621 [Penicillium cinerascens]
MPITDSLAPSCTPAERAVVKSYGSWTNFMLSFGLKPWNDEDLVEAKRILAALASDGN